MRCYLAIVALILSVHGSPTYGRDATQRPEAFIAYIYKDFGKNDQADPLGARASKLFTPRLVKLIRADEDVPVGDIGRLDGDPLCDCQDAGGFRLTSISIKYRSADRVVARVRMKLGIYSVGITLDLHRSGDGWLVADVHTPTIPSLVSYLSQPGG